jgi:hypothetical protein
MPAPDGERGAAHSGNDGGDTDAPDTERLPPGSTDPNAQ